jgi:pyruvate,water dikinase
MLMSSYVKRFGEMTRRDFQEGGGKAANLSDLTRGGFTVPPGFCVTARSLEYVIESSGLQPEIDRLLSGCDYEDYDALDAGTAEVRRLIENAPLPVDLEAEIRASISELCSSDDVLVAVRSSVAIRGTDISSFPGMMDTFHYLRGTEEIIHHIRLCWASLYTSRACASRRHKDIDHGLGLIAPIVQQMVDPEVAGIMFTANPITGARDEIVIESNWGLGESVVSGKSVNDFFILQKSNLSVKDAVIVQKSLMVCFDKERGSGRMEAQCDEKLMDKASLSGEQLAELGRTALEIEKWFGAPQDIEWAFADGRLYILQSRNVKKLVAA